MEYYEVCGINKFVEHDIDMLLAEELRVLTSSQLTLTSRNGGTASTQCWNASFQVFSFTRLVIPEVFTSPLKPRDKRDICVLISKDTKAR